VISDEAIRLIAKQDEDARRRDPAAAEPMKCCVAGLLPSGRYLRPRRTAPQAACTLPTPCRHGILRPRRKEHLPDGMLWAAPRRGEGRT
jgi:hypothetical protein